MLKRCLDSCLEQTYPNLEIIVSDNASPDNTVDVMKEYLKDKRVKYFRQEKNICGEQWRKLLYEYATGEYGLFVPDDDYLINKNHVSEAIALIRKYRVDYILSNYFFFDQLRNENERFNPDLPEFMSKEWAVKNIGRKVWHHCSVFPGLLAVFSIEKARQLKAFEHLIYGLDYEIGMRFMLSGDSVYLKGAQRVVVNHSENTSKTEGLEAAMEGARMFDRLCLFGLSVGHNKRDLKNFRRRCLIEFLGNFVSIIWYHNNKASLKNLIRLYRYLRSNKSVALDRILCLQIMLTRTSLLIFLRCRSERFYFFLRKIYRWVNRINTDIQVTETLHRKA
jgi:glycosyltransferase involved in cell wall biosynthesis